MQKNGTSPLQELDPHIWIEDQIFVPIAKWTHVQSKVNETVLLHNYHIKKGTQEDVVFVGQLLPVTKPKMLDGRFFLNDADKYIRNSRGQWVKERGKFQCGIDETLFDLRRPHFLLSEEAQGEGESSVDAVIRRR